MTICTAFNSTYRRMGELCLASIVEFCIKHPSTRMACGFIGDDFKYPHSWFKVGLIRQLLPCSDYVLWVDADTLLTGNDSPYSFVDLQGALTISKDENGINCGVMAWPNSPMSLHALGRLMHLRDEYRDHQWWEQAALSTFVDELSVHYAPKHVFNAYPTEVTAETQIVHFAGIPHPEREATMAQYAANRRSTS